jgi:hypothetical protein
VCARDALDDDGPPPAKRQRIMKTKEFKTEYLNLQMLSESDDDAHHKVHGGKLKKLMEVLRTKRKIVVIAGAGISVSAGSMYTCPAQHHHLSNMHISTRFPIVQRIIHDTQKYT